MTEMTHSVCICLTKMIKISSLCKIYVWVVSFCSVWGQLFGDFFAFFIVVGLVGVLALFPVVLS